MKKLLLIFAIALASCTPEAEKTVCNCNAITTINNVPNGETYPYSEDCKDNGEVLIDIIDEGYRVQRIVKCD
jgi:hypothetical protein